ncbi:MAG TPA: transcriptional repressor LexA [Terriglobia bacterium]|jgi:repressor LexA|nr:transcriptional repressor LexA [Terriglobia bacterium]
MALTKRQKQVLDFLVGFINHNGYAPSFEEIAHSLDLSSLATVHKHVATLERKGFIRRGYNQSRSIDVVALPGPVPFTKTAPGAKATAAELGALEFPLLGRIAAGRPVEAVANPETLSLGDFARAGGKVFVLRVKGDSMIDDHICDGDYILVEGVESAENGEIVVALIEGTDATLKRFFRLDKGPDKGKIRLQPANSRMDPIMVAARDVKIQGRVIGVLRKY